MLVRNSIFIPISTADIDALVSGGGGWGLKQGLLSLDPQEGPDGNALNAATFGNATAMFGEHMASTKPPTSNEAATTTNYWLQFFVENLGSAAPSVISQELKDEPGTAGLHAKSVFAPSRSTTDDAIPSPIQFTQSTSASAISPQPNHFGAVSSRGIYWRQRSLPGIQQDSFSRLVKIDLPKSAVVFSR